MKKLMLISIGLIAACASVIAVEANFPIRSLGVENLSQNIKVVNVCDLSDNDLTEITLGNHPEIAVEFSEHSTLPIRLFLKGDLINLMVSNESCDSVEIKQTFYARCVDQNLIFSTNLSEWKPFLEFVTGNASISLNIIDGKPSLVVGAVTNQRISL